MRSLHVIVAAGLLLAAFTPATHAKDSSWTLRVHGAIVESSAESRASIDDGITNRVEAGGGFGVGAEYRMTRKLGLEFSVLFAGLEIDNRVGGGPWTVQSLELTMMPLTLAVPYHFDTGGRVDIFVAPSFGIVRYVDIETRVAWGGAGTRVDVDSDAAIGVAAGVDVPIGKGKWAFSAGLRYLKTSAEDTDIDPAIVTIGFAYRF
jgi:outer membrane protein W